MKKLKLNSHGVWVMLQTIWGSFVSLEGLVNRFENKCFQDFGFQRFNGNNSTGGQG